MIGTGHEQHIRLERNTVTEFAMKTTAVLLVDDDHDDFLLTQDILQRVTTVSYRLVWVDSYERAIQELGDRTYDVVLVDYRIGKRTGLEFIREAGRAHPHCPMILLTGLGSSDVDIGAQEAGAADYLVKGTLSEDLLDRSIRYACQQAKRMALLNSLLTNATSGTVAIDANGTPLIWNEPALVALDIENRAEPAPAVAQAISHASPAGRHCEEITNREGNTFEVRSSDIPGGGKMVVLHDVTQRKQVEELLRRAAADAQAANDAKSSFLANFSHELRTPLAGILGIVRVLEGSGVSEVQRDYLETVKNCGLNLLGTINDILDLSKIEAGYMAIETVEFDVCGLVDELVRLLAPVAFHKGVEIAAFVDPCIPRSLLGDPHRLRQILTNLVGNAIKFTEAGAVVIRAAVEEPQSEPPLLRFDVIDNGIGIPQSRAKDLFQRFTQVDASTTRKYGGTGLGLALSRELIDLMGGRIWVNSEVGQGSTFSFTVPLVVARGQADARDRHQTSALPADILFISPVAGLHDVLKCYVEALGGRLTVVPDPATARRVACEQTFGLILIDAMLAPADIQDFKISIGLSGADTPHILFLEKYGPGRRDGPASLQRPLLSGTIDRLCRQLADANQTLVPAATPPIAAPSGRLKILVAEDNSVNQQLITTLLHSFGCDSEIASDGGQVLAACASVKFDVILMDLNMPVIDGIEATKRLRTQEATRFVPIIGLTATSADIEIQRCLSAGMDNVLTKPIDWDRLFAMLEALKPVAAQRRQAS